MQYLNCYTCHTIVIKTSLHDRGFYTKTTTNVDLITFKVIYTLYISITFSLKWQIHYIFEL